MWFTLLDFSWRCSKKQSQIHLLQWPAWVPLNPSPSAVPHPSHRRCPQWLQDRLGNGLHHDDRFLRLCPGLLVRHDSSFPGAKADFCWVCSQRFSLPEDIGNLQDRLGRTHENPWKSMKIHENPWKFVIIFHMKIAQLVSQWFFFPIPRLQRQHQPLHWKGMAARKHHGHFLLRLHWQLHDAWNGTGRVVFV